MIAFNFNPLCKEAELYYYDFLSAESQESVPEYIIDHINNCRYCCEQINQLKDILSQVEDYPHLEQKHINPAAITWLKLHFAYIGKPVNCETAKPFLPGFLEPALEVKIPTPITVHLDNCRQCREDLEAIRKLNLNGKQLYRLSRLFAEKNEDNISCSRAKAAIFTVVSMFFGRITEERLKHLCICPDCRKELYQCRETFRNKASVNQSEQKTFPCEEVSSSDIFDYTIPYGFDPAKDPYAKFRQSLTSHICSCPTCLGKMQQLHNIVFGIFERAESEITTIYHIDESVKTESIKSDNIYAGFPIRVETAGQEDELKVEQPVLTVNFGTVLKQKVLSKNLKPLLKISIAAAAVILIAASLFLNISTAKAVTLRELYRAVEKAKNVHISSFIPGKKEPIRQQWVSRTLNVNIIKSDKESVLWDITNKVKKIKIFGNSLVETTKLTAEVISEIQNIMTGSLGLMPFYSISEIPINAKWNRVDDKSIEITNEIEVYDLTWSAKTYDGSIVSKKWRFFVDAKENLPHRIEIYQALPADTDYILMSSIMVEDLSDSEMHKVIQEAFF